MKTMSGYSEVAKKMPKKKSISDIRSIRIEKAANGFTVSCEHEPKPSKKDAPYHYESPEQYVFESGDAVMDFMGEIMGKGDRDDD